MTLVPNTIESMAFDDRDLNYWVLGPSGLTIGTNGPYVVAQIMTAGVFINFPHLMNSDLAQLLCVSSVLDKLQKHATHRSLRSWFNESTLLPTLFESHQSTHSLAAEA